MITKYSKLTDRQREVFDVYVECRSLSKVSSTLEMKPAVVYDIYDSKRFQEALKEHNDNLKDRVVYTEAVIIDKLWLEYNRADASKDRVNILAMLGKHIGMFSTNPRDQSKPNIQYNIVNYNQIKDEIEQNKEEVEKEVNRIDAEESLPEGVEITNFTSTLQ